MGGRVQRRADMDTNWKRGIKEMNPMNENSINVTEWY
jgi:hypothetical protein